MDLCKHITSEICLFLPRNIDPVQMQQLMPESSCEVEQMLVKSRVKAITVYYGQLTAIE
jgi:hypothetical protein